MLNEGLATRLHLTQAHTTVSSNIKKALHPGDLETMDLFVTILSTPYVTRNGSQMSSHS